MARAPKIDAVLGAGVDLARSTLLATVDAAQVGDHLGVAADADRVLTHRFEARLPGYAGWNWYVTLARVPRGKEATVCETGLLPGDGALLAPEWVPWADRVRPEELAAQKAAGAAAEDGSTEDGSTEDKPAQDPTPGTHDDDAPADTGAPVDPAEGGTDVETVDTAASPDEPDEVVEDDEELVDAEHAADEAPRRSRSRRRRR